jgi:uncharacterized membrane protein (UPF0127 family)
MMPTRRFLIAFASLWLTTATAIADPEAATGADLDRVFRREPLQIATPDARMHSFNAWIADDEARRERGLMFIRKLEEKDAMLFIWPRSQRIGIWMKNTYVPLDILFVGADGKVTRIVENAEPLSLKTLDSGGDMLGVVELPGGTASKLKIQRGALVMHAAFNTK